MLRKNRTFANSLAINWFKTQHPLAVYTSSHYDYDTNSRIYF